MPSLVKLTRTGRVTLPKEIWSKANMEPGDYVEVELNRKGHVVLKPKKLIDASQAWFWTPEWQAKERAADQAITEERIRTFDSIEEMLNVLDRQ